MASVIRSVAVFEELPTFVWSDNVGVLAPRQQADEIVELVRSAFLHHDAGPFQLGKITRHRIDREFKFLGTNYRRLKGHQPEAFIARAIAENWVLSIGSRLLLASQDEIERILPHIASKRAAWGWWTGWPDIELQVQSFVEAARRGVRLQW